jgi:hypothetical protein
MRHIIGTPNADADAATIQSLSLALSIPDPWSARSMSTTPQSSSKFSGDTIGDV